MNAIDQMMHSMDAKKAQSPMAAFFSSASTTEASNSEFAKQFAAALSGTSDINPVAAAIKNGSLNVYAVAQNQSANPDAAAIQQAIVIPASDAQAAAAKEELADQIAAKGFHLVKVTPENFDDIYGDIQNAAGSASATGTAASPTDLKTAAVTDFTIDPHLALDIPDSVHILPASELEALIAPLETAATQGVAQGAAPAAQTVATTTNGATLAATEATTTAINTGGATAKTPDQPAQAQTAATTPSPEIEQAAAKTLAEKAGETAAAKAVKEQPVATDIKAQKTAEAEAHGLQTQQAANAQKKLTVNNQLASQQNSTATNQAATAAAAQTSANNQFGEQKQQSRSQDQKTAPVPAGKVANNAPQMAPATQAAATAQLAATSSWTPERLSGFGDGFSTDAYAGGLSGLRGEGGHVQGLDLLGGKAPSHMGGQIAKQLNLQMTNAVKNGDSEFTMRLDPAELGRVQVKMQFGANGKVSAQVLVERPETLELLQREVRGLERAIEAGGHKADQGGISFNLDTGDGESAGKAFAEAMHKDQLNEKLEANGSGSGDGAADDTGDMMKETDMATLEEILSRVTPETGLDVQV